MQKVSENNVPQMRMTNMLIAAIKPLAAQQAFAQKDNPSHRQQENVYANLLEAFEAHKAHTLDAVQRYDEKHPYHANAIGREIVAGKIFGQYVIQQGEDMCFDSRIIDPQQMEAVVAAARMFFRV